MQPNWRRFTHAPLLMAAAARARTDPADMARARRLFDVAARIGDGMLARRAARRCLAALLDAPDRLAAQMAAAAPSGTRERADPEAALAALSHLLALVPAGGPPPFLVFGALLGAVRDGRLIPGDSDVDVGVIGGARLIGVRRAIRASPLAATGLRRIGGRAVRLSVRHPNGCRLDLKAFEPEEDGALSWSLNFKGLRLRKRYPGPFALREIAFHRLSVAIPDPAEPFLEWQYGPGWRVPDPGYDAFASGPAHGAEHLAFLSVTGPGVILAALRDGRAARALARARSMAALFPEDPLWPRLIAALAPAVEASAPAADPAAPESDR